MNVYSYLRRRNLACFECGELLVSISDPCPECKRRKMAGVNKTQYCIQHAQDFPCSTCRNNAIADGKLCAIHDQKMPCMACEELRTNVGKMKTGIDYPSILLNDLKYSLLRLNGSQVCGEPISQGDGATPISDFVQILCAENKDNHLMLSHFAIKLARFIEKELK